MSKANCFLGLGTLAVLILGTGAAVAAPTQRWNSSSVSGGDFVWVGNTLTQTSVHPADARSTAVLNLPEGAVVKYARLYWAAEVATVTSSLSSHVALNVTCHNASGPNGVNPFTADKTYSVPASKTDNLYESSAPVTDLVLACGSGAYQVGGVAATDPLSNDAFVAWSLVVFYALETESSNPYRNLALFDGLDAVKDGDPATLLVSGFSVPSNYDAKLGVMAFSGDADSTGDALLCNGHALSDENNPADDFFNGTRSWLGVPVGSLGSENIHNNIGDFPRVDGAPNSMRGFDLDVVDIAAKVASGDRLATLEATSTGDTYLLGALVTSIGTCAPNFSDSIKTYANLSSPGKVPAAGDIIQYTILVKNTGNDDALGVVLTDPLPAGVTYYVEAVDGGIDAGASTISHTVASTLDASTSDAPNDSNVGSNASAIDSGTADSGAASNPTTVTVKLGEIAPGESKTVTFEVKINIDVKPGQSIANQASISATGKNCNVNVDSLSSNGKGGGPTVITVVECTTDTANCKCDPSTKQCVECVSDSDCGATDSGRVCYRSLPTSASYDTCIDGCRGTGGNGCPSGEICSSMTSAIGYCYVYSGAGGAGGSSYPSPGAGGAGGTSSPGTPIPGAVDAGVLIFPPYDASGAGGAGGARYDGSIDVGGAGGVDGGGGYGGAFDAGGTRDLVADVPLLADLGTVGGMDSGSGTLDSSAAIDVGVLARLDSGAVDAVTVMADASPDIVPVINPGIDAAVEGGGSIQGGGCSCNTLGTQSTRPALGWLMLFGTVLGVGLRSRKRRR